jgi:negative regulator of flagellin synthesis FlgM
MQIYGPNQIHGAQPINGPHARRAAQPNQTPAGHSVGGDQLDISEAGSLAARMSEIPDVRADLVARVRGEIANGTYETEERFNVAVERLLGEIG